MRKSLLAAIMAATAIMPAAAVAQEEGADRPHRGEGRGQWEGRPQRPASVGDEGRPQWRRPEGQPALQAPPPRPSEPQRQPQPQVQPAPQAPRWSDRGERGDGLGGRPNFRPDRGADRGVQPQAVPPQQPSQQPQGRPFDGRTDYRGGPRGGRPDFDEAQRGRDPRADGRGNDGRGNDGRGNDGRGGDWRDRDHRSNNGYNGYNGGWNGNGNGYRNWNRDWRRDNRYNYNYYRNQNRNVYHLPRYYAPPGWGYGYRRFSIGFTLSAFLFDPDYWIDDAAYYRLPPAYGPYRWVRYYNDALLVDIRTGYVVDTVYDIFW